MFENLLLNLNRLYISSLPVAVNSISLNLTEFLVHPAHTHKVSKFVVCGNRFGKHTV